MLILSFICNLSHFAASLSSLVIHSASLSVLIIHLSSCLSICLSSQARLIMRRLSASLTPLPFLYCSRGCSDWSWDFPPYSSELGEMSSSSVLCLYSMMPHIFFPSSPSIKGSVAEQIRDRRQLSDLFSSRSSLDGYGLVGLKYFFLGLYCPRVYLSYY